MELEFWTEESVKRIAEIMKACADDFHDQTLNNNATIASISEKFSKYGKVFAACEEGEVAGFIAYYNNDPAKNAGYISMITVRGKHQGKRIGSALLDHAVIDCRDKGFRQLRLEVADDNDQAVQFYRRKGFMWDGAASEKSSFYALKL